MWWIFAGVTGWALAIGFIDVVRGREWYAATKSVRCMCGYDLSGLGSKSRCPECGGRFRRASGGMERPLWFYVVWALGLFVPGIVAGIFNGYADVFTALIGCIAVGAAALGLCITCWTVSAHVSPHLAQLLFFVPWALHFAGQSVWYAIKLNQPYDGYNHWTMLMGVPVVFALVTPYVFLVIGIAGLVVDVRAWGRSSGAAR